MPDDFFTKSPPERAAQPVSSQFALLGERGFVAFLFAQSLAAFDAALAFALAVTPQALGAAAAASALAALLGACTAAVLAGRGDATALLRCFKLPEAVCLAFAAFALLARDVDARQVALALFAFHAAAVATIAYPLVRRLLDPGKIVGATALLVVGALLGVLAALGVAPALVEGAQRGAGIATVVVCALAAASSGVASLSIPATPANDASLSMRRAPARTGLPTLGLVVCCFCLALLVVPLALQGNIPPLLVLAAAVGVGALLCERLSGRTIELGLPACAAMGLALCCVALAWPLPARTLPPGEPLFWRNVPGLAACGVFFGLCLVHLEARLAACDPVPPARAAALATLGKGVALAAALLLSLAWPAAQDATGAPSWALPGAALGCALFAVASYRYDPHSSMRFLTDLLVHSFYRLGKLGFEHIPARGAAVLVCNHVSFVDAVIIMAAVRRPIRFVIDHRIYESRGANALFRACRTIPIATAKESPAQKEAAFAAVAEALRNGELIGLFPEGGITRHGELNHFRYGVGRIVAETPVVVVPMALRGLWGSFFSRRYGAAMSKPSCLRWRAPVELVAGPPVAPQDVSPEDLQLRVGALRGAWL